jgi:hypothetical protein
MRAAIIHGGFDVRVEDVPDPQLLPPVASASTPARPCRWTASWLGSWSSAEAVGTSGGATGCSGATAGMTVVVP